MFQNNLSISVDSDLDIVSESDADDEPCCFKLLVPSQRFRTITGSPYFKLIRIIIIVIYALNIVAWGGMLFLVLVGAANKTMPDEQTRKVWIEIDSQILNALFCVTGIGLIPCRVRDLYQLHRKKYQHRLFKRHSYTRSLIWIRVVVWSFIANSLFQIGMAICMWSMDMNTRPGWLVGIFVAFGCCSGAAAGLIQVILARRMKKKSERESPHF